MALTTGTGPLGARPAGKLNFELGRAEGILYFERSPRWVRGWLAGENVVDSRRAKLLFEQGHLPIYYFPRDDVRMDLLEPTDKHTRCPWKGVASYWSVRVGDQVAENAVWSYPEPHENAPWLAGHLAFYWDRLDEWCEEDERVIVHARDPYHRVDVLESSRHVRISLNGEVLAETNRARALFESGLPPRWYVPPEDVRQESLTNSDTHTGCPYKGIASYWSATVDGHEERDLIWSYPDPLHDAERVKGYLAFFNERVDIELDGELQERPETQWSPHAPKARAQ